MFFSLLVGGKLLVTNVGRVDDLGRGNYGAFSADLAVDNGADTISHLLMQSNSSTLGMGVPDMWLDQNCTWLGGCRWFGVQSPTSWGWAQACINLGEWAAARLARRVRDRQQHVLEPEARVRPTMIYYPLNLYIRSATPFNSSDTTPDTIP